MLHYHCVNTHGTVKYLLVYQSFPHARLNYLIKIKKMILETLREGWQSGGIFYLSTSEPH